MNGPAQARPATTPPISQICLDLVNGSAYPPAFPNQRLDAAAASVESTICEIRAGLWPRDVPFPHLFIASTIDRESWINRKRSILFHDEGVQDIVVTTAQAINFPTRHSASFPTFLFIMEQLVVRGRLALAALLGCQAFPVNATSHPIFSAPEVAPWRQFIADESEFDVHLPAKGFVGVGSKSMGDEFPSVGRLIFLAHELGHYLAGFPESKSILASLKTSPNVLRNDEASADLIGAVLTIAALSRPFGSRRPGGMTWLVATTNLLLQIHHAFVEVRRVVKKIADNPEAPHYAFESLAEVGDRAKLVARELGNPDTVQSLFRIGGSRAKVIRETLAHYQKYAAILVDSILRSAAIMIDVALRAWTFKMPPGVSWPPSDDDLEFHSVLFLARKALGNDIFRAFGFSSNQAPPLHGPWRRPPTNVPLHLIGWRSVGMKKVPLTNGIFLNTSNWRLEPC